MGRKLQRSWLPLVTLVVAIVAVFAMDIVTPLGVPVYILCFPILAVAALWLSPRAAWGLFGLCTVLITLGSVVTPEVLRRDQIWLAIEMQLAVIPVAAVTLWLTVKAVRSQTALREAAESLQHSAEQFRQFIEQAPAAVAMFDRDMRYLAHSRRWLSGSVGHHELTHSLVGTLHYSELPNFPEHWKDAHRRALAGETVRCEPTTVDAVISDAGLPPPQVLATLSVLEMRPLIRRLSGNLLMRI